MLAIPLALLGAIGLGGVAVSARGAMRGAHPVAVVGVSMALAVAIMVIAALVFASADIGYVPAAVLPWIAALGVAHFIGVRFLGMVAVNIVGASCTSLFIAAQEPFAAFFAITLTGEALRPLVVVGTIAVVIALMPATGDSLTQGQRTDRRYLFGYLVGLVSGASMGAGAVPAKQSIGINDSPLVITSLSMLVAQGILLPPTGVAAARDTAVRAFDRKSMGFIGQRSLSTVTTITSQFFAVQRADVVVVAPRLAAFPLWTLLLSHLFIVRLEAIALRPVIGAVLAVTGVMAVSLGGRLLPRESPPTSRSDIGTAYSPHSRRPSDDGHLLFPACGHLPRRRGRIPPQRDAPVHPAAILAASTVGVVVALLLASGDSLTQGWRTDRRYLVGGLLALGAGLTVGAGSVVGKQALGVYDSPLAVNLLGMLVAMALIVPAVGSIVIRNPAVRDCDRKSPGLVSVSGLSTATAQLAQFFAIQRAHNGKVAPKLATFPLWTLLQSHVFIARLERITPRLTVGALLAVAGVIAVTLGGRI